MQPSDALLKKDIQHLPTVGDGRQSGTSESPSILKASPESVVGGGLASLQTGDRVHFDINSGLDALVPPAEWQNRRKKWMEPDLVNQTIGKKYNEGQLTEGGRLELGAASQRISRPVPRHNH